MGLGLLVNGSLAFLGIIGAMFVTVLYLLLVKGVIGITSATRQTIASVEYE
jgi:hypothetical protein